jgi:Protein of unknown function (DUF3987)/Primase C terminal 2 (PriCT-2)/Bifunctional DNA primase/polymerase, N-terminal
MSELSAKGWYELYTSLGFKLCSIMKGTKKPFHSKWNKEENLLQPSQVQEGNGMGLVHEFSGTCALDIDDMIASIDWFATKGIDLKAMYDDPRMVRIFSGRQNRGKLLFRLAAHHNSDALKTKKVYSTSTVTFEVRHKGVQDCIPPSVNPDSNSEYSWQGDLNRIPVLPEELYKIWLDLVNPETPMGKLSEAPVRVVNEELDRLSKKFKRQDIIHMLSHLDPDCGRQDWLVCGMAIKTWGKWAGTEQTAFELWNDFSKRSVTKYPGEREMLRQWQSFNRDGNSKGALVTLRTVLKLAMAKGYEPAEDFSVFLADGEQNEDVLEVYDDVLTKRMLVRSVLSDFQGESEHLDAWPATIRARAAAVSTSVGSDIMIALMGGLAAVSAAAHKNSKMYIKNDFAIRPILWAMVVAKPSSKKTPSLNAMMDPLMQLEDFLNMDYPDRLKKYTEDTSHNKMIEKQIGALISQIVKNPDLSSVITEECAKISANRRSEILPYRIKILANDVNSHFMQQQMQAHNRGLFASMDEMGDFFRSVTSPGAESKHLWLKAYDGGYHSKGRAGAGDITTQNCAIGIIGNIQPMKLREFYRQLSSDGMINRFIPVFVRDSQLRSGEELHPDEFRTEEYTAMLMKTMNAGEKSYFLDPLAKMLFNEWTRKNDEYAKSLEALDETDPFVASVFKAPGHLARLIFLFHLADHPEEEFISEDTTLRAIRVFDNYLHYSIRATFGELASRSKLHVMIRGFLMDKLIDGKNTVTFRELEKNCARGVERGADVRKEILETMSRYEFAKWVYPVAESMIATSDAWTINSELKLLLPDVFEQRIMSQKIRSGK